LTNVIISYVIEPMVPRWTWNATMVAELGQSSKKIFLNTMVMALWMNLDRLLGPYWVVNSQLGAYVLAWNLASAVEGLLTKALDVHYSQMARKMAQTGHAQDLDELHERAGRWKRLYVFPCIVLIAALAPTLIWVLYDHRYEDARLILPLLILRLIPRLHGQFHFQRLLAQGHLAPATWAYLLAAIVQVAVMGPLCRWTEAAGAGGGKGLALSVMISTVTWTLAQDILAGRFSGKARWEWVHFLAWAGGGAAVASFF
jgi:O-antigen/teichoic acid export membrane protein